MSASSKGASGVPQCACTNISLMQLFHELKQQFPGVPDHVVSNTIATHCHDKSACQTRLRSEAKASLTHAFLATAARKDKHKIPKDAVLKCPNQIINEEQAKNEETESDSDLSDSQSYQILKSDKVKSDLNKKLVPEPDEINGKPKRPCTLEFAKPKLQEKNAGSDRSGPSNDSANWDSPGFNVSVNLNCRMDLTPSHRLEEFQKPRGFASVNLTVCTPTSSVASPSGEFSEQRGFEGRVTVTVNPSMGASMAAVPTRRAPPPPVHLPQLIPENNETSQTPAEQMTQIERLRGRQRIRLQRMRQALAAEKARLAAAAREVAALSAPLPPPRAARRFRASLAALRHSCQTLATALDRSNRAQQTQAYRFSQTAAQEMDEDFYEQIYTGQQVQREAPSVPAAERMATRPHSEAPSEECSPWVCHMCTFRNHGLLNKCEECDMPRILLGTGVDLSESLDSGIASLRIHDVPTLDGNILVPRDRPAFEASSNSAC